MAKQSGCTVVVEPVSVAKSRRVTPEVLRHTDFITPNIAEASGERGRSVLMYVDKGSG